MQKVLVAAAAFVIGAAVGMGVLVAVIVVAGYVVARHGTGIGAVATGVGHGTVLIVPVVFGALATWWALRRLKQIGA